MNFLLAKILLTNQRTEQQHHPPALCWEEVIHLLFNKDIDMNNGLVFHRQSNTEMMSSDFYHGKHMQYNMARQLWALCCYMKTHRLCTRFGKFSHFRPDIQVRLHRFNVFSSTFFSDKHNVKGNPHTLEYRCHLCFCLPSHFATLLCQNFLPMTTFWDHCPLFQNTEQSFSFFLCMDQISLLILSHLYGYASTFTQGLFFTIV